MTLNPKLSTWMTMKTQDVIERFASLPKAQLVGDPTQLESFVYIPPSREDSVLLVSHSDTVFDDVDNRQIKYHNDIYSSGNEKYGIGADDRAGIAILWELRNSGHALLIPNGEEKGCVGSSYLMQNEKWRKLINSHRFMIEFDRMNNNHLVFYQVGSPDLLEYLQKTYIGYRKEPGAWTDICVLAKDIAAVNISVGYYSQHSSRERLVLSEWYRTLSLTRKLLQQKNIPKFVQKPFPVIHDYRNFDFSYYDNYNNRRKKTHKEYHSYEYELEDTQDVKTSIDKCAVILDNELCQCPHCDYIQSIYEIKFNQELCCMCFESLSL